MPKEGYYMATNGAQHLNVKKQKIADAYVGVLQDNLLIPNLFRKHSVEEFKGALDDTVNVKVPGILPFHDYAWRSGKSDAPGATPGTRASLVWDNYKERTIGVTFGGNVYQGVKVTDEQADFDLNKWSDLINHQTTAIARGLGRRAVDELVTADYEITIGGAAANLRGALIEARRVMNALKVPTQNRYMVVGSDFEALLLDNDKLSLAQNVGDNRAASVVTEASLGRLFGFTFIVDQTVPSDAAYAFDGSAFIFLNAAPSVPSSIKDGSTATYDGVSLRWIKDYDTEHFQDRSVVNTYAGFQTVTDVLSGWAGGLGGGQEVISGYEHFVRGVKISLGGTDVYPSLPSGWADTDAKWKSITDGYGHIDKTKVTKPQELALLTGLTGRGAHYVVPVDETP